MLECPGGDVATCSEYCSELLRAVLRVCVCKQCYQSVDDDRTVTCRCAIYYD